MDYIEKYGNKKTSAKEAVLKFQQGGSMGAPGGPGTPPPPAEGGGGGEDPQQLVMEYAQTRDPQLAVKIADMLVDMMAAEQGAVAATEEGAVAAAQGGTMIRKQGGRIVFSK